MGRVLLSGNEAIAQGAWEAGAYAGIGYPGTPSTETLERFATFDGVYAEWAPNEKVALEVAAGVSLGGKRALATMKHVGLNVAADPLFTLAYTGVGAGLVIFVGDDPGLHSSQNEQDSHNYAAFARIPMLDPADSSEASEFTKLAFELSEKFDLPVLIRSTVRVAHAKTLVEVGERVEPPARDEYKTDPMKWVMMPGMARIRRMDLEKRMAAVSQWAQAAEINRVEYRDTTMGIICAGVVYQYVREAAPDASVLKLGMTYPVPEALVREFAGRVDRLVVIEEADPYLSRSVRQMGIEVSQLDLPVSGELSPGLVRHALGMPDPEMRDAEKDLPPRPPLMCPGCPHRPVFDSLRRIKAVVSGDIGCYTLGALKPLGSMDTCVDMGASIGMAHGMEIAGGVAGRPIVAVIGDSTFAHSGITGVLDVVYNSGGGTILILDNRITAMTGHQGNPVNGITLQKRESRELDIESLLSALGVTRVRVVDPQDFQATEAALREETAVEELSVIIFRAPCALLVREARDPFSVDEEICTACARCVKLGCPAIGRDEQTGKAVIDIMICTGCGQCVQVCKNDAILRSGASCDAPEASR